MTQNLDSLIADGALREKTLFLFGHCNATEELAELLFYKGYRVEAILDNSLTKQGMSVKDIRIVSPESVNWEAYQDNAAVLIVTRFYEAMSRQLKNLGFPGKTWKLVDYNTFSEYSLSGETIMRKKRRLEYGQEVLQGIKRKYPGYFRVFCPFPALGDIYFTAGFLPRFLKERGEERCVICVPTRVCEKVVSLFGDYPAEVLPQKELDAAIQAVIYTQDTHSFIAHQDRPYVVQLSKALYAKKIPLEEIYARGVFGFKGECALAVPTKWKDYSYLGDIHPGRAAVLSPYAKSVVALPGETWRDLAADLLRKGFQVFTNVFGDEKPIEGTVPISPEINEMKSVVERAGLFIGIRSGLCDILRTAGCRKVALYPDYFYCDTKWKAIEMYSIDGFENIAVGDGFSWRP